MIRDGMRTWFAPDHEFDLTLFRQPLTDVGCCFGLLIGTERDCRFVWAGSANLGTSVESTGTGFSA